MAVSTHEPFQRLLADGFQVAMRLAVAFGVAALVVIVGVSHVAGAAFGHQSGAEHLPQNSLVVSMIFSHPLLQADHGRSSPAQNAAAPGQTGPAQQWPACRPASQCPCSGIRRCSGGKQDRSGSKLVFTNGFPVRVRVAAARSGMPQSSAASPRTAYRAQISGTMAAVSAPMMYGLMPPCRMVKPSGTTPPLSTCTGGHFRAHRVPLSGTSSAEQYPATPICILSTIMPSGPCEMGSMTDTRWTPFFSSWYL